MTLQHLKYILTVAEKGSISEAARELHVSQPSLSNAIKEVEKELCFPVFTRNRLGIALTKEGVEFTGYARQVIQEMDILKDHFVHNRPRKKRFCVSTQHYTFTTNAFVEMVQTFGQDRFEFILNETQTHQIIQDVKNRFSDLGILYLGMGNKKVIRKELKEEGLVFYPIFSAKPHVFMRREHPLAKRASVKLKDLEPYPRLNFLQGSYESASYAEEPFSDVSVSKEIRVSDRMAVVNLMIGLNGYTISSGIFPRYLHGDSIVSIPLDETEEMQIGYILNKGQELSELGRIYVDALRKYEQDT